MIFWEPDTDTRYTVFFGTLTKGTTTTPTPTNTPSTTLPPSACATVTVEGTKAGDYAGLYERVGYNEYGQQFWPYFKNAENKFYIYVAFNGNWHFSYKVTDEHAYVWGPKWKANAENFKCPAAENAGWYGIEGNGWMVRTSEQFNVTTESTTTTTKSTTTTTTTGKYNYSTFSKTKFLFFFCAFVLLWLNINGVKCFSRTYSTDSGKSAQAVKDIINYFFYGDEISYLMV